MNIEFLQAMGALLAVAAFLIGPSVWYSRTVAQKSEKSTADSIKGSEEARDKLIQSVLDSQSSVLSTVNDLKAHIDNRFNEVYETVDKKSADTRQALMEELRSLRDTILRVETKSHNAQEHVHELEKKMLRIERDNHDKFLPKEHLETLIRLQNKD